MFGTRLTPFEEAQVLQSYNPEGLYGGGLSNSEGLQAPSDINQGMGFAFLAPLIATVVGAAITTGGTIVAGQKRSNSQLKVMATTATDEVERNLAANRDWFLSLPNPINEEKQAAVDYFHAQWGAWVQAMTPLGEAGARAINERKRGGVNSWGPDWWELYLDPIMSTPTGVSSPSAVPATGTQGGGSTPAGSGTPVITVEQVGGVDIGKVALVLGGLGILYFMVKK